MITRKDIAAQLSETARLLEVLGEEPFRARGFHSAARAFEAYEGDVGRLYREGRLTDIRGVGSGTEGELQALFEQGMMPLLAELRQRVPDEVKELFAVSGLGAKRIGTLWRNGIVGLDGLQSAANDGRLSALPGFGPKSAAGLAEAAAFAAAARARMRLDEAERLHAALAEAFRDRFPDCRLEAAGEYRRGLETVAELELVIAGVSEDDLRTFFAAIADKVVDTAGSLAGFVAGRRVRVTPAPAQAFGALLLLRTGNDDFLAPLLAAARERGLPLDDSGAFTELDLVDEDTLFARLGIPPVPPELREEALARPVPGLVRLEEIRGLVHNHTTWSDAGNSLREMVAAARERGYSYLAIADHSRSSTVANGLSVERLRAQAAEVKEVRRELAGEDPTFELLHGVEVDIQPDGSLDYPDEVLAELDYTVVSVHQQFNLSREAQTARIERAVRNPYASILGHLTGRLLLRRPGYEVDVERIIRACAETGTVLEINANPRRLELDWRWLAFARDLGCRFSINPDAHTIAGFGDVRFGVTVARKGGLRAAEVINTVATGSEFLARLRPTHRRSSV